jgi:hypothetical protein
VTEDEAITTVSEAHARAVMAAIAELVEHGYDADELTTTVSGTDASATHVIWFGRSALCTVTSTVNVVDKVVSVEIDTTFIPPTSGDVN